jgi:(2Fe-2S) ferredoxin
LRLEFLKVGPFQKHVFVCTSGSTCPVEGNSQGVHARLKELVKKAGLKTTIRINNSGCMDQCGNGPMIVVYPENVWYCHVRVEDADAIFEEHLVGGQPVERLIYRPLKPGANKICKEEPPTSDASNRQS